MFSAECFPLVHRGGVSCPCCRALQAPKARTNHAAFLSSLALPVWVTAAFPSAPVNEMTAGRNISFHQKTFCRLYPLTVSSRDLKDVGLLLALYKVICDTESLCVSVGREEHDKVTTNEEGKSSSPYLRAAAEHSKYKGNCITCPAAGFIKPHAEEIRAPEETPDLKEIPAVDTDKEPQSKQRAAETPAGKAAGVAPLPAGSRGRQGKEPAGSQP